MTHPNTPPQSQSPPRWAVWLGLATLLTLGSYLRWRFISTVQPYPDEFVTLLAVRRILELGTPTLPSGLFYEHGWLFSYVGAGFAWLMDFGRLPVRLASLTAALLTLALVFQACRRWFGLGVALTATLWLALAPSAVLWGGRARMYALLQLWVCLTLVFGLRGLLYAEARWRWLALLTLLAATLTHFVAVALLPPLGLAALLLAWLRHRPTSLKTALRRHWPRLLSESAAFGLIALIAFLLKRAGQPKGIAPLETSGSGLVTGIAQVLSIYSEISFNLLANWQAIAPFFTQPEMLGLSALALIGWGASLFRLKNQILMKNPPEFPPHSLIAPALGFILSLTTLEMLFLVSPDRRDDKYLFMLLPVLLILAAVGWQSLFRWLQVVLPSPPTPLPKGEGGQASPPLGGIEGGLSAPKVSERTSPPLGGTEGGPLILALKLLTALALAFPLWQATQSLLSNPGDNYDAAFAHVAANWQAGDTVLTGTPAAAAIYLNRNDFYAVRGTGGYAYRLLGPPGQQVDRWLGSPWLGTDDLLYDTLTGEQRVWLILERWGLVKEYYSPLTQQRLLAMTDFVREDTGVIVLRSRPTAPFLPETPAVPTTINFDYKLILEGYTLQQNPDRLILMRHWSVLNTLPQNYSIFLHLRTPAGQQVAQVDHALLAPVYPTTLWPVGATIREHSELRLPPDLPPGEYELWFGVYDLETLTRLPVINDTSGENAVRLTTVSLGP